MNFGDYIASQYALLKQAPTTGDLALRERAWQTYQAQGLPGTKSEAWKYTSIGKLISNQWHEPRSYAPQLHDVHSQEAPQLNSQQLNSQQLDLPRLDLPRLDSTVPDNLLELMLRFKGEFDIALLMNGHLQLNKSYLSLEAGYEFKKLQGMQEAPTLDLEDGFLAATLSVHRPGYDLFVAPDIQLKRPLMIVHFQEGEGSVCSNLNQVILGKNSHLNLCEVFLGGSELYLRADVTRAKLDNGAKLDWLRIQEEGMNASHYSEVQIDQQAASQLSLNQFNGGAAWMRGSLKVAIRGVGAEVQINGISFGRDAQHIDQRVEIRHWAGHSKSSQLFKGILSDRARVILNGKIYIAKNAQKVVSSQFNHNLLLSSQAEADTKPELEIYADDVKANHGATVGKMDDEKLFYLQTRGIPLSEARQMLARAFVEDVLMKVSQNNLREVLQDRLTRLLPFYAKMENE